MRTEQWIRTQKKRVKKKYRKGGIGNKYFSPKEFRDFRHGKHWIGLRKAVKKLNEGFRESTITLSEAVKVISDAYERVSE